MLSSTSSKAKFRHDSDAVARKTVPPPHTPSPIQFRSAPAEYEITVFTSDRMLSKRITLLANGTLRINSDAAFSRGKARRVRLRSVKQFAAVIKQLNSKQAIATGTLMAGFPDEVVVTTKDKLENGVARPDLIARSKDYLEHRPEQPGFLLFDTDTKGMPANVAAEIKRRGGFWSTLCSVLSSVLPELPEVARVIRHSTSGGLTRTDTGQKLPGSENLHTYTAVKDANDSKRFLQVVHDQLWLAGFGWGILSKTGGFLDRSLIDAAVGSPERLVFEGAPILIGPLRQDGREPIATDGVILDTAACPDLTDAEQAEVRKLKATEKRRLEPEAVKVRAAYINDKAAKIVAHNSNMTMPAARRAVRRQCVNNILLPSIELQFDDKKFAGCTVGDILKDPQRFAGAGAGRSKRGH